MLDKELRELALKHFPAAQAGALKEFIDKAQLDKAELDLVKDTLKKANETIHTLQRYRDLEEKLKAQEMSLEVKERHLKDVELRLETEKLKYQLTEVTNSKNEIFRLVETLVKNPRSIEMFNSSENIPGYYNDRGHWVQSSPVTSIMGTKEKTETKD